MGLVSAPSSGLGSKAPLNPFQSCLRLPLPKVVFSISRPHRLGGVSASSGSLDPGGRHGRLRLSRARCAPKAEGGFPISEEKTIFIDEYGISEPASAEERIELIDKTGCADETSSSSTSVGYSPMDGQDLEHDTTSLAKVVVFWILAAVVFGVGVGIKDGTGKASEFFAGYLLEKSLSVDNLFVFILIFKYFKVPTSYQGRVLSYGIAGAVVFRAIMIILGTATLQRFEVVNVFLALILIYSAYKLFVAEDEETDLSDNFIVKTCQKFIPITSYYDGDRFFTIQEGVRKATPLLLTVAVLELSDVAFAIDSIPAVFGVTRDPFIVFSSNMFAILGLRSLYRLISESLSELDYLQPSIGIVLGFIGSKMLLDFCGYHIPTEASLGFVATILGGGLTLSLTKKSE